MYPPSLGQCHHLLASDSPRDYADKKLLTYQALLYYSPAFDKSFISRPSENKTNLSSPRRISASSSNENRAHLHYVTGLLDISYLREAAATAAVAAAHEDSRPDRFVKKTRVEQRLFFRVERVETRSWARRMVGILHVLSGVEENRWRMLL